ncbi:MAG: M48 family metallopeptidase [Planctomycetaceae bacterium]|nr:M48 family metallopeptidase [Planctomycetaceae bacterium]
MSTGFFEQQDVAKRRTGLLVFLFCVAVVAIVLAVYTVVALVNVSFGLMQPDVPHGQAGPVPFWNPQLFGVVTLATVAVIALGSLYKISELSAGGEAVALMLGGRRVHPLTKDFAERQLLNVVEEMALASGVPVPPVYVLDAEDGINAFAAGHRPGDAVIGVSRGSLDYLDRDELQGVMAHEFSHILNGDMRLDLRLVGVLHGILILAVIGYYILRSGVHSGGSGKKGGAGAILLVALGLMIIGGVGLFFGRLIKSAVSRQREYLADASAVQFTRYPAGIAGALKKIGGLSRGSRINDAHAGEVSHMFFGEAVSALGLSWLGTHPPLADRIRRIDPSFDGRFPKVKARVGREPAKEKVEQAGKRHALGQTMGRAIPGAVLPGAAGIPLAALAIPGLEQILYAAAILESMPQPVTHAVREPYGARAVVYCLLLGNDEPTRNKQLGVLRERAEPQSYEETVRLTALVRQLAADARIPLADMAIPALKELAPSQYDRFCEIVEALVRADNRIELFEYALQKMLLSTLDVHFGRRKPTRTQFYALGQLGGPLSIVLGTLAHAGNKDPELAGTAYRNAMQFLDRSEPIPSRSECSLRAFDDALTQLAATSLKLKQRILDACQLCIVADEKVTTRERELVRVVAAVLECAVPLTPPAGG